MTSVEELWNDASMKPEPGGTFRLLDETHPLDLFAGFDLEGRRVLMLVTDHAPKSLPQAGIIEVILTQRGDSRFNLVFRLGRPEYQELFGQVCQDLVETSRDSSQEHGTEILLIRLDRWRKLLDSGPRQGLSEKQLRGLFGELWFLRTVAIPHVGQLAGVHAWKGPTGAPQDFQLFNGLVEVKTVLPGAHKVAISSAEQLEHGDAPLQLAVLTIDPTQGITLPALIDEIRGDLALSSALGEFDLRLAEAGYSERPEHTETSFTVLNTRYYAVNDTFPLLVVSKLPLGVSRVTYDVDLLHCGPYRSKYSHDAG
jgi:hypothetical protein